MVSFPQQFQFVTFCSRVVGLFALLVNAVWQLKFSVGKYKVVYVKCMLMGSELPKANTER